ncbi:MAG: AAA family ATPase [Treponema sp.]|nr:AAA family ATPase [Treponema sp.]
MKVITFSSMKGGVGKTTNSVLVTNCLAARGFKVLYFDLDIFNNSGTTYFTAGLDCNDLIAQKNSFEALSHNEIKKYAIHSRKENVDLIANNINTNKLRSCGYNELSKTLKDATDYDYVIIDTAPSYDNLVINALLCADLILTPIQFSSFCITTSQYLQTCLYDDCPNQVEKWYLLYSWWEEKLVPFETSLQSQFVKVFENNFDNILDVHIPKTNAANNYIQTDTHINIDSPMIGNARLAKEINKLVNMITGIQHNVQKF